MMASSETKVVARSGDDGSGDTAKLRRRLCAHEIERGVVKSMECTRTMKLIGWMQNWRWWCSNADEEKPRFQ